MGWVDDGGGEKEEVTWQCLSHSCRIWVIGAEGGMYIHCVSCITKSLWLRWLKCCFSCCGQGFNSMKVQKKKLYLT